jgi:hypothetical protein
MKMDCADREKIKSNYKDLDKREGKRRVELKIKLANLKIIVYLQVLGFVFTATAWVFGSSLIFLINSKFHPTIQMLLSKANCRVHVMTHAPMRCLCHSHGGEKQQKR